jgi:hypothetical protein
MLVINLIKVLYYELAKRGLKYTYYYSVRRLHIAFICGRVTDKELYRYLKLEKLEEFEAVQSEAERVFSQLQEKVLYRLSYEKQKLIVGCPYYYDLTKFDHGALTENRFHQTYGQFIFINTQLANGELEYNLATSQNINLIDRMN